MTPLRTFLGSRRAVIATEFALVAPLMILLWMGLVELATAHMVKQKIEIAAQSAADIIAQNDFMDDVKLNEIEAAIRPIIYPYDPQNMGYDVASIVAAADGTNSLAWDDARGALSVPAPLPSVANNLTTTNDSVIVVTVKYNHTPVLVDQVFGHNLFGGSSAFLFSETVFARPRLFPVIPCTVCPVPP